MSTYNDEHEPITVMLEYKPERHIRPFYCCRCSKWVCDITGEPRALIPGQPEQAELGLMDVRNVVLCRGVIFMGGSNRLKCTAKYYFN